MSGQDIPGQDISWDRLDKQKFFLVGIGLFSGVTTTLFPLSVIKTRQMAAHNSIAAGLSGTRHVAQQIWQHEGIKGFYRGFGTVLFGTIPGRTIYMNTLEWSKSTTLKLGERYTDIPPAALAGIASGVGGAAGSLSTQAVVVPIDVVSQRLMVQGTALSAQYSSSNAGSSSASTSTSTTTTSSSSSPASSSPSQHNVKPTTSASAAVQQQPAACSSAGQHREYSSMSRCHNRGSSSSSSVPTRIHAAAAAVTQPHAQRGLATAAAGGLPRMSGLQMARLIVQQEGIGGLYRGFWPSVATFVPSNAIWWGAYGFWQRLIWQQLLRSSSSSSSGSSSTSASSGAIVGVQAAAGILSGCTAALMTNPLDLVKTRLQVADAVDGVVPRWSGVLRELLVEEGPRGLLRGVVPRMASSAMWGTCMVTTYEFLKRICALPEDVVQDS